MKLTEIFRKDRRDVALVLSSGGARGLAHIGAIEELERRGYLIRSVAGTSMGALVGGMYASGHLDTFRRWMMRIDKKRIRELTDYSLGIDHFVKGERIIQAIMEVVPDMRIEDMPIPFCAVATDWNTGREIVFRRGSLYEAIRASISVPGFFSPVHRDDRLLIDGGITNPFPLDRVKRHKDDLLVGVNVSGHDYAGLYKRRKAIDAWKQKNSRLAGFLHRLLPDDLDPSVNYFTLISQTMSISIAQNARRAILLNPPDILADIPMKRYGSGDYDKFDAIRKVGACQMAAAITRYEQRH